MVDENHYESVVNGAFHLFEAGDSLETVVEYMHGHGLVKADCVQAIQTVASISAEEADRLVRPLQWPESTPRWHDADLHDAVSLLEDAFHEATQAARRSTDPAAELGSLRAHLAFALNLVQQWPTPDGGTAIVVPSDDAIIDAVERLLAAASDDQRPPSVPPS